MSQTIIIQDTTLRNYLRAFQPVFGVPQWKYFVTVLMGLIHCQASRTLSGLLREVAILVTVSGLSRFLISPAWTCDELARARYAFFCTEVIPIIAQTHATQRLDKPKRKSRSSPTVVTGYLILDDSTHIKRYAKNMSGLGGITPAQNSAVCLDTAFSKVCTLWKADSNRSHRRCTARSPSVSEKGCHSRANWIWQRK